MVANECRTERFEAYTSLPGVSLAVSEKLHENWCPAWLLLALIMYHKDENPSRQGVHRFWDLQEIIKRVTRCAMISNDGQLIL
jgi:hypothetical protein